MKREVRNRPAAELYELVINTALNMLHHAAPGQRRPIIRDFDRLGEPDRVARRQLVGVLEDRIAEARVWAARCLGRMGGRDRAVEAALREALRDADARVRISAAVSLWRLVPEDGQAFDLLLDHLEDWVPEVRLRAARALGDLPLPERRHALFASAVIQAARAETDAEVFSAMVKPLLDDGPRTGAVVELLVGRLRPRTNPPVIRAVLEMLGRMGPRAAVAAAAVAALRDDPELAEPAHTCLLQLADHDTASRLWLADGGGRMPPAGRRPRSRKSA